jgi:hypothetical protein
MNKGRRTIGSKINPTHSLERDGCDSTSPLILDTNHSAVTPTIAASTAMTICPSAMNPRFLVRAHHVRQ